MEGPISYKILSKISEAGVVSIQDAVGLVSRKTGTYLDYIPLAVLLHAGYIETDIRSSVGSETVKGKFGFDVKNIAEHLFLVAVQPGERCEINGIQQPSWSNMDAYVFMTASGALRLEEVYDKKKAEEDRTSSYRISLLTAVLAALISAVLSMYLTK